MKNKAKTALIATLAILDCTFAGLIISKEFNGQPSKDMLVRASANYVIVNELNSLSGNIEESVRDKEVPVITGVKDITIYEGDKVDFFNGITITDNSNDAITKEVIGKYDLKVAGEYILTYQAKDTNGNIATSKFKLIVKKKEVVKKKSATAQKTAVKVSTEKSKAYKTVQAKSTWKGIKLTKGRGAIKGPSGKETYYNLNMNGVVKAMKRAGYNYKYWVRSDGVKMFGNYVMVAANLKIRPKGTIIQTSLGLGIVCDTGGFAKKNPKQLDIATAW